MGHRQATVGDSLAQERRSISAVLPLPRRRRMELRSIPPKIRYVRAKTRIIQDTNHTFITRANWPSKLILHCCTRLHLQTLKGTLFWVGTANLLIWHQNGIFLGKIEREREISKIATSQHASENKEYQATNSTNKKKTGKNINSSQHRDKPKKEKRSDLSINCQK